MRRVATLTNLSPAIAGHIGEDRALQGVKRYQIHSLFLLGGCLVACTADEPPAAVPEPTGSVASAITSSQGISYQGISYQGTSYGAVTLSGAAISGSALIVWQQRPDQTWEQRFPDKLCVWNAARTVQTSCTTVNLATSPSPLTGATWQATFTRSDGTTVPVTVQIGASATQVGAVHPDTAPGAAPAMFALNGSSAAAVRVDGTPGAACSLIPQGQRVGGGPVCNAPGGCRANCDVWLYDVRVPDTLDASGQPVGVCPPGELAIALAGTWDGTGTFTPSSTLFTFACTSGTIAKCTRWGYRPWDTALMSDGTPSPYPLASYHQACIRAAIADYCADGTSWTRNGTLVDVYDYYPAGGSPAGFIERTRGGTVAATQATALVWESSFDGSGAAWLDHTRYQGITDPTRTPNLECPSSFVPRIVTAPPDGGISTAQYERGPSGLPWQPPPIVPPLVSIDSTPVCAHAELTVGTWLHPGCSPCAAIVSGFRASCTQPGQRWDATCVQLAQAHCTASQRMASHSECTAGAGIGEFASGCALQVELDIAHEYCATSWDSGCASTANARCNGGQEATNRLGQRTTGFCGPLINGT